MGYQINSTWTRLRKNDIERLNAIIDDEYCNELEIGRKLNIMDAFERKFNEVLKDFNFDVVIEFMTQKNWTWSMYIDGKSVDRVPTRLDIIRSLRQNFLKHGLYEIIERNKKSWGSLSGGLVFEMGMREEDYPSIDNVYINIYFDIAQF